MDMFETFLGSASSVPRNSFLSFTPLTPSQKNHVARIYAALAVNVLLTGVGVYFHLNWIRLPAFLSLMLSLGCVMGVSLTNHKALREAKVLTKERALFFGGFGVLNGMIIANYLHAVHHFVGPQVIPTAFIASVAVFCCFSASALVAKQRSYLYLGSFLSSALAYLTLAGFLQMFLRIRLLNDVLLWGGLFTYLGFVVYDTQLAIAQFDMGNRDYLVHALQFYVNILSIFLRIVALLSKRAEENNRRKRGDEDR